MEREEKNKMLRSIGAALFFLIIVFGDAFLFAEDNEKTLKQKIEEGIVKVEKYQDRDVLSCVQEPQGDTPQEIDFKWQLVEWPFNIKYPSQWYAREAYYGTASLSFTKEPIFKIGDQFQTGMSLFYYEGYFLPRKASKDSEAGKMAKAAYFFKTWESSKKDYIDNIKSKTEVISISEGKFAGQSSVRVECKVNNIQMDNYYVKVGNNLMIMTFEAPASEFAEHKMTFENIAQSINFTK